MREAIVRCGWAGLRSWSGVLVLGLGLMPVWLAARPLPPGTPAAPGQRPPEQEEEVKPKNKKILDPDAATPAPPPVAPAAEPASKLAEAAQQARLPAVKKLFRSLAVPHDMVIFQPPGHSQAIEPVPERVIARDMKASLSVVPLDDDGKLGKPFNIHPGSFKSLEPYEVLAHKAVQEFLGQGLHTLQEADPRYLSRYDQLLAAELVLREVKRFHESARQTGQRKGDGWGDVGGVDKNSLHGQLLEVLVEELQYLVDAKQWDEALSLGRRLTDTYPLEADQGLIARPLADLLRQALRDPLASTTKMREARQHLRSLLERYPGNKVFKSLGQELEDQAKQLFKMARETEDKARRQDLLQQAEETCPQLADLRAFLQDARKDYPVLRVGVRELPDLMSPALACTDTEKRVVEMLFESLVKVSPDAAGLLHYQPGLAQGRPQVVALGRQFQLPRNAFWSNDKPLTGADVRSTVTLLKKGLGTGRALAWGDLLDPVYLGADPFRLTVPLNQGYLEPLSLMTFKIVPQAGVLNGQDVDKEEFARQPVGSGPFRFDKIAEDIKDRRRYARFVANLNYGSRPDKRALPRIQEIRFYTYQKPDEAFLDMQLDLLLDLTPDQRAQLRKEQLKGVTLEPAQPCNRRVYFLAVNHRNALLRNVDLRRALFYAIDREAILRDCFRAPQEGKEFHKALNGPYPAHSWANHPALRKRGDKDSLDLYDADLARGRKQVFDKTNNRPLKLTLKYPAGDEQVKKAMEAIRKDVEDIKNITIEPVAVEAHELRKQVEGPAHEFELAYYHYDYPDETYWLWPLLGQRGLSNGGNYMGYANNQLDAALVQLRGVRDFEKVRDETRELHKSVLLGDMPLIPLWQLDPMLARRDALKPMPFDPWLVFTDIENWQLERR